jgi:SAM-dependent methyltransferase
MILRIYRSARFRLRRLKRRSRERIPGLKAWLSGTPPVGLVRFGTLRRLQPIATHHGSFRGKPIDRYYIERFLQSQSDDIRGRVLEIGESVYTRTFGGDRVVKSDVLHVEEGNPNATIVADLTAADNIESGTFDCIICTQTIQFIYDVRSAICHLHRILQPGGVLLATTHGIGQLDSLALESWGEYWRFTSRSARLLFEEVFGSGHVEVEAHGNVLTAMALLQGLTVPELKLEEFEYHDPIYEVLITIRAVKSSI